jgi:hypothetical protein
MTGTAGDLYSPIVSGSHSKVEEVARQDYKPCEEEGYINEAGEATLAHDGKCLPKNVPLRRKPNPGASLVMRPWGAI